MQELVASTVTFVSRKIVVLSGLSDEMLGTRFLLFMVWSAFYAWLTALTQFATMKLELVSV
jgi:membrane-associated PAP2 superfamily phosphatase